MLVAVRDEVVRLAGIAGGSVSAHAAVVSETFVTVDRLPAASLASTPTS